MKNQLFKICIFILLLFGCVLEPEKEIIYQNKIINIGEIIGDVPLQYSYTLMMVNIYYGAIWLPDPSPTNGMLLWVIAYNLSNESWYGYPEIRVYMTDEPMDSSQSFIEQDLIVKEIGILTTGHYNYIPLKIVDFIPSKKFRHALAFARVDYDVLKQYYWYILWRFVPTNTLSKSGSLNEIKYDEIKWGM